MQHPQLSNLNIELGTALELDTGIANEFLKYIKEVRDAEMAPR